MLYKIFTSWKRNSQKDFYTNNFIHIRNDASEHFMFELFFGLFNPRQGEKSSKVITA